MVSAEEGLLPVLAHGLLTPMAIVKGYALTLAARGDDLTAEERKVMLDQIIAQADFVSRILQDIVRGLPPDLARELSDLDARTYERHRLSVDLPRE